MQESEFRDWARRAQGSFDERLRVLEGKVGGLEAGPLRFRMPEHRAGVESLLKQVREEVSGGGVTGLGVIVVGEDGVVRTGWVAEDFAQYAGGGGVGLLSWAFLYGGRGGAWVAGGAGAASGETDEGRPEAREEARKGIGPSAASAPAGGA